MNLFLQYFFFFIVSIVVGLGISYFFYYRSSNQRFSVPVKRILFILRAITIAALVYLIFNPKVVFTSHEKIRPLILFAIDNSQSITYLNDSVALQNHIENIHKQKKILEKQFDIQQITFGERVCDTCPLLFTENETNISAVFDYINLNLQLNRPKAVILATDGLTNAGSNPASRVESMDIPVFSVVLADTAIINDYWISGIQHNPVVFSNNRFPVEIEVRRTSTEISNARLEILYKGKSIAKQELAFQPEEQRIKATFQVGAMAAGVHQYEVVLITNHDERNKENNRTYFAIEVVESETNILLLYNAPTPDIGLLRQSIAKSQAYKLDIQHTNTFNGNFNPYSVIIFMHLPTGDFNADRFVVEALKQNRSVWFFLGSQTNMTMLNQLNLGWHFNRSGKKLDLVYPAVNQSFNYFTTPPVFSTVINNLPPLYAQFGRWSVTNPSENVLVQRVGTVETGNPLLLTSMAGNRRLAVLTGEGIWRWGMYMGRTYGNPSAVYDLIHQVVQFLSVKPMASPFKLQMKSIWPKTSDVFADAYVYNINYQLVNDKKVELVVESEESKKLNFTMRPHDQFYRTNMGALPVGVYSVTGYYKTDSVTYTDKKTFAVADLNIEKLASTPDVALLKSISENNANRLIYNSEIDVLSERITQEIDAKPRYISNRTISDVIVFTLLLFLIAICTTFEWFLRKYHGQL